MVKLANVRLSNAAFKACSDGFVAIFIGGTSGIGEATVKALAANGEKCTVYIFGRNKTAAGAIISLCQDLSPESVFIFIQKDVSLLKNVDSVCEEIQNQEQKVDLLFMSQGYLTFAGRNETVEGVDTILSLRYYSRMRFATNLLLLLSASPCARVVSVFAPGRGEVGLNLNDLGLKENYSIVKSISHPAFENTFFMESLAATNPGVSFLHVWPGLVQTQEMEKSEFPGLLKWLIKWVLFPLIKLFCVPVDETGERMLFYATSGMYPALVPAISLEDLEVASGSNGEEGSGCYCINWNGETIRNQTRLERYRKKHAIEKLSVVV
ncbi:NAD(P)-binding protein [Glonium stellatum]|uniref:NAD(P)-binding protein n=1 Tax=Glonium stellatum TaxID=574774 RepID=A0A8E2F2U5_9PEZI|nr:NAD(P)-binding protein [Glonium stellatum]